MQAGPRRATARRVDGEGAAPGVGGPGAWGDGRARGEAGSHWDNQSCDHSPAAQSITR